MSYHYGDHGQPVDLLLNGSYLVKGATYNALKKVTSLPLGNGLTTTWRYYGIDVQAPSPTYPANTWYGRPSQVQTGTVQNQTFISYDAVGNLLGITYDDHTSETLSLAYNELNQLTQVAGLAGEPTETYAYTQTGPADLGNLVSKEGESYTYGTPPHAPSSVSGIGSYAYDAAGNRLGDGTYSYTYDAESHLTQARGGSNTLQNTFDGDGARVVGVANGTTTYYLGDWYEDNPSNQQATVYCPFNGQAVALQQGGALTYLHHDHLGSLVSATNPTGTEVGSLRYWPFGALRMLTGTPPTERLFTGQVRDLGDDRFYQLKARYYDATIGKFHTPDTVVPDPTNPQALNRYAYALYSGP